MINQFVPYELALKLKEIGFDEPCLAYYYSEHYTATEIKEPNSGKILDRTQLFMHIIQSHEVVTPYKHVNTYEGFGKWYIQAPLWSQAFDWFRTKYHLNSNIQLATRYLVLMINLKLKI